MCIQIAAPVSRAWSWNLGKHLRWYSGYYLMMSCNFSLKFCTEACLILDDCSSIWMLNLFLYVCFVNNAEATEDNRKKIWGCLHPSRCICSSPWQGYTLGIWAKENRYVLNFDSVTCWSLSYLRQELCTFIIDDSAHYNISGARRGRYLNRWRSVCCKFDKTEILLKKFVESSKTAFKYLPLYLNLFLIISFRRTSLKTA